MEVKTQIVLNDYGKASLPRYVITQVVNSTEYEIGGSLDKEEVDILIQQGWKVIVK